MNMMMINLQVWDKQPNQSTECQCQLCEEDEGEGGPVERCGLLQTVELCLQYGGR